METPELKKINAHHKDSQLIGEFLDWLKQDIFLCTCDEDETATDDEYNQIAIYYPISKTTEQLLADFFVIDLNKAEKERQALLSEIRAANTKPA